MQTLFRILLLELYSLNDGVILLNNANPKIVTLKFPTCCACSIMAKRCLAHLVKIIILTNP